MEFKLSNLSPSQVENASFVPRRAVQSPCPIPYEHALQRALNRLELRVADQESRIQSLENQLSQYRRRRLVERTVGNMFRIIRPRVAQVDMPGEIENVGLRTWLRRKN